MTRLLAALLLMAAMGGCEETGAKCVRDTECGPGMVCADGICSPLLKADSAATEAGPDLGSDGAPDQQPVGDMRPPDGGDAGLTCPANQDGKISRAEMIFKVPSQVTVTLGTGLTLDLKGAVVGGKRVWDLTKAASDDKNTVMKVGAIPAWAAPKFTGATYASKLSASFGFFSKTDLLGVFKVTPTALKLVGAASEKKNHTRFSYTTPLDTIRFPVEAGTSYVSGSTVTGIMEYAVPVWLQEKYEVSVLERGTLKLYNNFSLDTLLVSVKQEVYNKANPLLKTGTQVYLFMAECYGVVARVIAKDAKVTDPSKVVAKERWKLAAP